MNGFKILGPNGFKDFGYIDRKIDERLKIRFTDNSEIICSQNHIFLDSEKEIVAASLQQGFVLGEKTVSTIERIGTGWVYTPVEVDGHRYTSKGLVNKNCSFIGSSNTLINGEVLDTMEFKEPLFQKYGEAMNVFQEPVPGAMYLLGADPATGVGGDYSTIQVIRIYDADHYEQVACYANNMIKPEEFADVINEVDLYYQNALMVIESNDCGKIVLNRLFYELDNPNIINTDKRGIGTKAIHETKLAACSQLKKIIENAKLKVNDSRTIQQLSRFEEISPNVFKGAKGTHDDLVSALYWAAYAMIQPEVDLDHMVMKNDSAPEDDFVPMPMFGETMSEEDFWKDF